VRVNSRESTVLLSFCCWEGMFVSKGPLGRRENAGVWAEEKTEFQSHAVEKDLPEDRRSKKSAKVSLKMKRNQGFWGGT